MLLRCPTYKELRKKPDEFLMVTSYLSRAHGEMDVIVRAAAAKLALVDFDTMVGRGLSGAVVIPHLALELTKMYHRPIGSLIIRKSRKDNHANLVGEGRLGRKWLFVDDFVSTGATRRRVKEAVQELVTYGLFGKTDEDDYKVAHPWQTTFVGSYLYHYDVFQAPSRCSCGCDLDEPPSESASFWDTPDCES